MGTRHVAALASIVVLAWVSYGQAQVPEESCVTCHRAFGTGPLGDPVREFAEDIHAARGLGCVACHGGDTREAGMAAMDPGKGYIGKPERQEIPPLCGRCHSDPQFMKRFNPSLRVDQVAEYQTSVHGRRLAELDDPNVAICVSCHPAHSIRPPSDPKSTVHPLKVAETCGACHADPEHMGSYPIPTDQLEEYTQSVHWQALSDKGDISAPTCNDCHGNHGAAPPGVAWVGNVCGNCHSVMAELFQESFHSQIFRLLGTPGCATCHGNHAVKAASDEMLGSGSPAVCAMCHSATSVGGQVASEMRVLIDSLKAGLAGAEAVLSRAENSGMEVSQALFDLNESRSALVKARTAVHTFAVVAVKEEVDAGLEVTAKGRARGVKAVEELHFRRLGLAVSVTIILALIAGLVLKIRQLERKT